MTITLTVEDGTGRSDANAIVSLANFKAYCDERGLSYSDYSDEDMNGAIVRSSAFLVSAYVYGGQKRNRRDQTMPFPRYGMEDKDGWPIEPTEIPREFIHAACEIALREAADPGSMNPDVVLAEKARTEKIGDLSVEYLNADTSAQASRPTLLIVNDLLWPFLANTGSTHVSGKSYRG